ncbi:MAG: hypothetical protein ACXVXP_11225, partial [Mycobacteriaceae bacterium]
AVAEGLQARAGRNSDADAKPEGAANEPLAEWEQELLGQSATAEAPVAEAPVAEAPVAEAAVTETVPATGAVADTATPPVSTESAVDTDSAANNS